MQAVVMAGGEGTRLRPLTCNLPKPMVPILNIPIMHHGLSLLKTHGIGEVCATLQYLPKKITDYFGDGRGLGMQIQYFIEDKPLGTAGSVKNACTNLNGTFLVFSGDALTDIDLSAAIQFHREKGSIATLILKRAEIPLEYGVVVTGDDGRIVRFLEKPTWREVFSDTVNTGIYILEPEVLDEVSTGEVKDFSKNVFPSLLKRSAPMFGYITEDYWCDIGGIASYKQAQFDALDGKCRLPLIRERKVREGIWTGKDCTLPDDIRLEAPCLIGNNVFIGHDVKIGAYTVIGNDVRIGRGASVKRSIIWEDAALGDHVEARGTVICRKASLEDRTRIFEGAVMGDESSAGADTHIRQNVLIWPEKTIEPGSIVSENVIWEADCKKAIDIYEGMIRFRIGAIQPEKLVALSRVFGCCLEADAVILLCDDGTPFSLMVKQAMAAGFASQGIQCHDIGTARFPTACTAMIEHPYKAGVCICADEGTGHILLLGPKGIPVSKDMERKIQTLFERRDIPCRDATRIKVSQSLQGMNEKAVNWIIDQINTAVIYRNKPVIALAEDASDSFAETCLKASGCRIMKLDFRRFDLRKMIGSSEYLFGLAKPDPFGNNLPVMTREGICIDPMKILGLKLMLLSEIEAFRKAVVPVNIPDELVLLCKQKGIEPVYSKTAERDMMQAVRELYPEENLIFGVYFLDVLFLLKLVEHLSGEGISLEQMLAAMPEYHSVNSAIPCTPKEYGHVMRNLARQAEIGDIPEGIKLNSDAGWAFVLPDMETRSLKVFSQGVSEEYATDISERTVRQVKEYLEKKQNDN